MRVHLTFGRKAFVEEERSVEQDVEGEGCSVLTS